jgi:hypothetical protein
MRAISGVRELGAVDRDRAEVDDQGLGPETQNLAEELRQRLLVADAKARDRRVVGGPGWRRSSGRRRPLGSGAQFRTKVELRHRVDHEPGEVVAVEPVAEVWRQEHRLVAVAAE